MEIEGIAYRSIPTYSPENFSGKWWWFLRSIPVILQQIYTSHRYNKKVIVYSHPGAGVSLVREGVLLMLAKLFGAKTLVQVHAPEIITYLANSKQRRALSLLFSNVDKLAVLTPWWESFFLRFPNFAKISVVPNPLSLEWERKASSPVVIRQNNPYLNVFCMARIERGKGVELVVEAMRFLPKDIKLTVAGLGSQLEEIKNSVKQFKLDDRVRFCGWVTGTEKQFLLDSADIFCLPSSNDSFGMGFVEAMVNGLPVIALDWGPISDVVPRNRAGLLVKKPDPKELACAIEALRDVHLRRRLGEGGKEWVLETFSAERVGKLLRATFDELVS